MAGAEAAERRHEIFHPVGAKHGMVASQEARATRIGVEVLRQGGNAVDAAVAVGFALAVTLPNAGNLGGGGFMLIHDAAKGETVAIDYRGTAPAAASADMFLDTAGKVDKKKARFSHHSVGVPGTVAGLALALERHGTWPLARAMAPAMRLAGAGIIVDPALARSLKRGAKRLGRWPASRAIFLDGEGRPWPAGAKLRQGDLARSLRAIAAEGPKAFYEGWIADGIAAEMAANGGPMTKADLAAYRAVVRAPVTGSYRGYEIRSMPPPSSGGVHLVQILNLLEGYPLGQLGAGGAESIHLMAEAMKLAYADRSQHLGDPDHWRVPIRGLTSKAYAAALAEGIDPSRARPATEIAPGKPQPYESAQTTHFSVMDGAGNVVSNTTTLNFGYGTGIVAAGTGILLNNEMDDFSAKPGVPNAYGLVGGAANAIAAGKRPLSSMTPTILFRDGKPWLATGSPGGSRIITTVLQVILNMVDHEMNIAAATAAPRVHHQWLPDEIRIETGISPDTVRLLEAKGHKVVVKRAMGSTQSIVATANGFEGASDPRRPGALTLGY
ncbi:MAG: gamma-glutamyltransferase [Alphaproteobacteria bacterium]|nr:gamma-glutamyltransferase [Alphaproteobacteria bacterium]